jgi:hypothetical protein
MRMKNTIPTVLAVMLMFSNVVCACASADPRMAGSAPHTQHHSQEQPASGDCAHEGDCSDCNASILGLVPDRDAQQHTTFKLELDDDPSDVSGFDVDVLALQLVADAAPPHRPPYWPADTLVSQKDLLLE